MTPLVRVGYVDGKRFEAPASQWRLLRSDGVDWVEIDHVHFSGKSIYWLYREGDAWVAGAAPFFEDIKNPELVIGGDGKQTERQIEWVPDLRHEDVKLGWWRPGTEGEPVG